ncbi:TraB/GumN family protein [Hydrotalea sp.]|uniref:TraB/GumN family protein n=1 Tax=Hydrotalea sp. TaxID=2881279 RepID=UPI003D0FEE31
MRLLYKLNFIVSLILISFNFSEAQTSSLLWRVSSNQIKNNSYIFGTFHLLCPNQFQIPDTINSILQQVDTVYFEIKLNDPSLFNNMLQQMTMQNHQSLQQFIPPPTYDSMNNIFFEKTKMNLNFFQYYKPILVTSFLYPSLMGCNPVSLETMLQNMAEKFKKPMAGLETADYQFKILDKIPYEQQAKMLQTTLLHFNQSQNELKKMVEMYKRMNIDSLQKSLKSEDNLLQYENDLVIQRNKNWLQILINRMKNTACFVAVGAGHLGGTEGLINLLRKAGYTVTPISF